MKVRILILSIVFLFSAISHAIADQPQALILYDGQSINDPEGLADATYIGNLLGHFSYRPKLQAIEAYRPGTMNRYAVVFIVGGSDKTAWPSTVLNDARTRKTTLIWLGYGMDAFLGGNEDQKRGLRLDKVMMTSRFNKVIYRDTTLNKGGSMVTLLNVVDHARVKVDAEMLDPEGHRYPYMLHRENLWLVADVPFAYISDEDRYWAFCDLLHDMLGVKHTASRRAMVRLEDITPDDDPTSVRAAVDMLIEEEVPFQISLVPVFLDPVSHNDVHLADNPELVKVLHYATAHGGTLVLHGYTHQYRGVTPDDFEFWDSFRNAPRADDSPEMVREKLTTAIEECFQFGLYPIAWETPHYAASPTDYKEFAKIFSLFYEQTMIDLRGTQQSFPYPTVDMRGLHIVPENVGYLPESNPSPEALIANARAMLVVRDGIASAFMHPFLDLKYLRQAVQGMKQLGYQFISLRDFDARVAIEDRLIVTGHASKEIFLRDAYLKQFIISQDGEKGQETWSKKRMDGIANATLEPGPGQLLVGEGMDERPTEPPSFIISVAEAMTDRMRKWWSDESDTQPLPAMRVAIVQQPGVIGGEQMNQESFISGFRAYGVPLRLIPANTLAQAVFNPEEVLVVPHAAARVLSQSIVTKFAEFTRKGGQLILDGRSSLAEAVGIRFPGGKVLVGHVIDQAQVDLPLQWRPTITMERFRVPDRAVPLSRDMDNRTVLAATYSVGEGQVIFLGTQFDPYTPDGVSHYPFLFEHALKAFKRSQPLRRNAPELYFDPGLRINVSIEDLAVQWRRMGVRVVYASAWLFTPRFSYDYDRLIRVCHANGILVYAWFEFPQVSPLFWEQHPEWREVAAAGAKLPSWRLAMNLQNPQCRTEALKFMKSVIARWAWDGVNLAELNFDGKADGNLPWAMVPLNIDVRRAFREEHHFDPVDLFNPASKFWWKRNPKGWNQFLAYRTRIVTEWHRIFLEELQPFANAGHEVIVTMLDSLEHPEVTSDTGVDSMAIVSLTREYPFTLQVEDPASAWKNPPSRYLRLAERYRTILPAGKQFMLDINVIPNRPVEGTHLPCSPAVGTELAATVKAARAASDRVALYGDATVRTADLDLLSYAAADRAVVDYRDETWTVATPYAVELAVPPGIHTFYRGNQTWPYCRSGFLLLPPGRHTVTASRNWLHWFDTSELSLEMIGISSPLQAADASRDGLKIAYDSPGPVYACLNREPAGVSFTDAGLVVLKGARDISHVLILPAGRHELSIISETGPNLALDFVSLISSSLIVAFGTIAILALGVLYVGIRMRRFFHS
jgi:hypothetical protein